MVEEQTETLIKTENMEEAEKLLALLKKMTPAQQNEMLVFMQGVRFANSISAEVKQ